MEIPSTYKKWYNGAQLIRGSLGWAVQPVILEIGRRKNMKFTAGDQTDSDHCIALVHEFIRCDNSFNEFAALGEKMIRYGRNREISLRTYDAYARFIHHLYEFLIGCIAREVHDTKITNKKGQDKTTLIDNYITSQARRVLNKWVDDIANGTAPAWANHIDCYKVPVPTDFARNFREYRNKIIGHVAHERSSQLSLTEFYRKYHKFLFLLYQDSISFWRNRGNELPDLGEITEFSLLLESEENDSFIIAAQSTNRDLT